MIHSVLLAYSPRHSALNLEFILNRKQRTKSNSAMEYIVKGPKCMLINVKYRGETSGRGEEGEVFPAFFLKIELFSIMFLLYY